MKTYNNDGFCPNCRIGLSQKEIDLQYCQNCDESFEIEDEYESDDYQNLAVSKDYLAQTQMSYDGFGNQDKPITG